MSTTGYANAPTDELSRKGDRFREVHSESAIAPHLNFVEGAIAPHLSSVKGAIACMKFIARSDRTYPPKVRV
ncbi:hypothetical protein [Nostoc sp.]|uniref:hypothetical protein n=1 Tax=Nostoc sp. TaxID=1180 RepID=UPI002FF8DEEC